MESERLTLSDVQEEVDAFMFAVRITELKTFESFLLLGP